MGATLDASINCTDGVSNLNKCPELHDILKESRNSNEKGLRLYAKYTKQAAETMNRWLKLKEVKWRVDVSALLKKLKDVNTALTDDSIKEAVRCMNGKIDDSGKLFESQIATFVSIMASYVDDKEPLHRLLVGPTQGGKFGTTASLTLMMCVMEYTRTGRLHIPRMLMPNVSSLHEQAMNGLRLWWNLHRDWKISYKGKREISVQEYFLAVPETGVLPERHNSFANPVTHLSRNSITNEADFKEIVDAVFAKNGEVTLVCIFDECHYGTEVGGVFFRKANGVLSKLKEGGQHLKFIGVSATGWEHIDNNWFKPMYHYLGEGYMGPFYFKGIPFPLVNDRVKPKLPVLNRYKDHFGVMELDGNCYERIESWFKKFKLEELKKAARLSAEKIEVSDDPYEFEDEYKEYRRDYIKSIEKMVVKCLGKSYGKGVLIRVSKTNVAAEEIARYLEAKLSKMGDRKPVVIRFFGNSGTAKTIKQRISGAAGIKNYVILATADARMGINFPISTEHFIDLTVNSVFNQSEMQGLYGRACGYFKNSAVYVSDYNYDSIEDFLTSQGCPTLKQPSPRSEIINAATGQGRPSSFGIIDYDRVESLLSITVDPVSKTTLTSIRDLMDQMDDVFHEDRARVKARGGEYHEFATGRKDNSDDLLLLFEKIKPFAEQFPAVFSSGEGTRCFAKVKLIRTAFSAEHKRSCMKSVSDFSKKKSFVPTEFCVLTGSDKRKKVSFIHETVGRRTYWNRGQTRTYRAHRILKDQPFDIFQHQLLIEDKKRTGPEAPSTYHVQNSTRDRFRKPVLVFPFAESVKSKPFFDNKQYKVIPLDNSSFFDFEKGEVAE